MEIYYGYDPLFTLDLFKRTRENKSLETFVSEIEVQGLENLEQTRNKQTVFFCNHLSHFDYILAGYVFLDNGFDLPRFAAGTNLDLAILRFLNLDFRKLGAFFIDREKIQKSSRTEKIQYLKELQKTVQTLLQNKHSLWIFPEGGRSYTGKVMEKITHGLINWIIEYASSNSENNSNPNSGLYIANAAIHYNKRIEQGFFPLLAKFRNTPLYYALDALAYLSAFFKQPGKSYIAFGKPISLKQLTQQTNGNKKEIADFIKQNITELYEQVST